VGEQETVVEGASGACALSPRPEGRGTSRPSIAVTVAPDSHYRARSIAAVRNVSAHGSGACQDARAPDPPMMRPARNTCRLGAEGIVSERVDGTYRSYPCRVWIKVRNPPSIAVQREESGG
jgi:hypothetical protein